MRTTNSNRFLISVIFIAIILASIPYVIGGVISGGDFTFSGVLFNPLDGNSYLAKMYEGYLGSWKFHLPYTYVRDDGAYLFEFYLALGHLSRISHIPLVYVYHLFRLFGSIFLLVVLWSFTKKFIRDDYLLRHAYVLAVLGLGMGWMLLPFGLFTSDFWVAEAFPFLSMYANPHFSFGLGIILLVLSWYRNFLYGEKMNQLAVFISTLILSVINPFGVVIIWMVIFGVVTVSFVSWIREKDYFELKRNVIVLMIAVIGGAPVLLYDIWATNASPLLTIWDVQNITSSPPLWDLLISFSPYIVLIIVFSFILKNGELMDLLRKNILLVVWMFGSALLIYFPFKLQRRFMMGLYVPVVLIAILYLKNVGNAYGKGRMKGIIRLLYVFALPTTLILLASSVSGVLARNPRIFFTAGEVKGFRWVRENTAENALILTGPETGLFIPAQTGRRVLYGHPFETVNAQKMKEEVENYFKGEVDCSEFIKEYGVDYIFWGERENKYNASKLACGAQAVFSDGDLVIYEIIH